MLMKLEVMKVDNNKNIISYIGSTLGGIFTIVQSNEIFQLISLILTIISVLVSVAFSIYRWIITATKDGKIDEEEVNELTNILDENAKNLSVKEEKHNER